MRPILASFLSVICVLSVSAQTPTPAAKPAPVPKRAPTAANVAYGTHERQVLDFYKAESAKPAPLLFFIHGGGWVNGDKANPGELEACLAAGISVVSINYRYSYQAQLAGVMPPVKWPLRTMQPALCSSSAVRPLSGTSTSSASVPAVVQQVRAAAFTSPSMMTWPTPRAAIPSPVNPPASGARR